MTKPLDRDSRGSYLASALKGLVNVAVDVEATGPLPTTQPSTANFSVAGSSLNVHGGRLLTARLRSFRRSRESFDMDCLDALIASTSNLHNAMDTFHASHESVTSVISFSAIRAFSQLLY